MFKLNAAPVLLDSECQLSDLSVRLLPDTPRCSIAPLKGEQSRVEGYLSSLKIELPRPTKATLTPLLALPLGQGQWLIQGEMPDLSPIADHIALTDQSDAWCGFQLQGSKVTQMLERLVATAPDSYSKGYAVRTLIEHIGCWVVGLGDSEWLVLGPRSSAKSLFEALKQTALSVDALTNN